MVVNRPFCIIILRNACSKKKHVNCVAYVGGPLVAFSFLVKFYQLKNEECEKMDFWDFNC